MAGEIEVSTTSEFSQGRGYLTLRQAASYLSMSPTTLYRITYRMTDRLPFYKVGKLKLFRMDDIEGWMKRRKVEDLVSF